MTTISKTTFTFTVLHRTDEPFNDDYDSGYDGPFCGSIAEAMQRSFDGNAVGDVTAEETVPVEDADVADELVALGNDGEFFDNDLEDAASTFAELLRRKLAEYDDALATPGQARDIAERDLLDDVRNILSEESEEAQS